MENKILYNLIVLRWNVERMIKMLIKEGYNESELEEIVEVFLRENYENLVKMIGNSGENFLNRFETENGEIYYGTDEWIVSQSNIE